MSPFQEIERRVRPRLRSAGVLGVLALAAVVVGHEFSRDHPHVDRYRIASWALAGAVVVLGVAATRSAARQLGRWAEPHAGTARTAPLRVTVQIVGYLLTVIGTLDVLAVDLSQLLVGGALTGVVLGIAAQQSLGNFFAGLVLLVARPYTPGDRITVYSGAVNGPHSGVVVDVGLLYTTLQTAHGPLHLPNSVLLGSAVGPQAAQAPQTPAPRPPDHRG